jgi:hypothetical protein
MPEHSDQSLSSEEYSALLVDVPQWLEQARKQAGIQGDGTKSVRLKTSFLVML